MMGPKGGGARLAQAPLGILEFLKQTARALRASKIAALAGDNRRSNCHHRWVVYATSRQRWRIHWAQRVLRYPDCSQKNRLEEAATACMRDLAEASRARLGHAEIRLRCDIEQTLLANIQVEVLHATCRAAGALVGCAVTVGRSAVAGSLAEPCVDICLDAAKTLANAAAELRATILGFSQRIVNAMAHVLARFLFFHTDMPHPQLGIHGGVQPNELAHEYGVKAANPSKFRLKCEHIGRRSWP